MKGSWQDIKKSLASRILAGVHKPEESRIRSGSTRLWRILRLCAMALIVASASIGARSCQSGIVGDYVCLSCHDGRSASDTSSFPESLHSMMMDCEDCHGPGYLHVRNGGRGGLFVEFPADGPNEDHYAFCATCHETQVEGYLESNSEYHLNLRCSACHDIHLPQETRSSFESNDLCLQCHASRGFDNDEAIEAHTLHPADAANTGASRCTSCHMPPMQRLHQADGPHNHSLSPLPPVSSNEAADAGTVPVPPNSCSGITGCHDGSVVTAPVFDVDDPEMNDLLQLIYDTHYGE